MPRTLFLWALHVNHLYLRTSMVRPVPFSCHAISQTMCPAQYVPFFCTGNKNRLLGPRLSEKCDDPYKLTDPGHVMWPNKKALSIAPSLDSSMLSSLLDLPWDKMIRQYLSGLEIQPKVDDIMKGIYPSALQAVALNRKTTMDSVYGVLPELAEKVQRPIWELATLTTTDDIHNLWTEDFQLLELNMLSSMDRVSTMADHDEISSQEKHLLAVGHEDRAFSKEVVRGASSSAESFVTTAERSVNLGPAPMDIPPQPSTDVHRSKTSCPPLIRPDFVGLVKRLCKGLLPKKERCVICLDSKFADGLKKLPCQHKCCDSCLSRMALKAVTDEQLYPPKCCTKVIPQEIVTSKLRRKEKLLYAYKVREYATPKAERRYCPALGCGRWISFNKLDGPSLTQNCPYCNTALCARCHNAAHDFQDCPYDDGLAAFIRLAQMQGWQRCYNCGEVVERASGCDHIACRCGAQFCYNCGKPWIICCCGSSDTRRTEPFHYDGTSNGLTVEEIAEFSAIVTAVVHAERELEVEMLVNER